MAAFLDVCRFTPTLGGTTDWTFSTVVTGYQTPTAAGAQNGRLYKYRAESLDLSQWEIGEGAYNSSTGVFARTTVLFNSAGTNAKISFTVAPQVAIVALKEDLISVEEANSFTSTQKDQASTNIGTVRAVRMQKFTSSGTYTPDAHLLYAIIECVGGGGGGGGVTGAANQFYSGGGGGSGGYSRTYTTAATVGASKAVTIGAGGAGGVGAATGTAGGTTSVGTLCIANGGAGGTFGTSSQLPFAGAGATAGTGDMAAAGAPGTAGMFSQNILVKTVSGNGGSSVFGGGATPPSVSGTAAAGTTASNYGSGGSGSASDSTASTVSGGSGSAGFVIITEYCSQ